MLHAAAYGAKTQETIWLEPASAPSSMQSHTTDRQTWGETNNNSLETFVLSLLYLTGKKVDLSLLCLQPETPVVATMVLTLCAIMKVQTGWCVIVFNRKEIVKARRSVENIFISENTDVLACHTCGIQGLWL